MSELDRLFDRMSGQRFDPNRLPQEIDIGIGGVGFVQSGWSPVAAFGAIPWSGAASPGQAVGLQQTDAWLIPVSLPGAMRADGIVIEIGSSATSTVKFALCSDLGQGAAVTVVAVGTLVLTGAVARAMKAISMSVPTDLPPGNYWLMIVVTATTGFVHLGFHTPFAFSWTPIDAGQSASGMRLGTWSATFPTVGDTIVVDSVNTFPNGTEKMAVGMVVGLALDLVETV